MLDNILDGTRHASSLAITCHKGTGSHFVTWRNDEVAKGVSGLLTIKFIHMYNPLLINHLTHAK